jgi:hypothetical protein
MHSPSILYLQVPVSPSIKWIAPTGPRNTTRRVVWHQDCKRPTANHLRVVLDHFIDIGNIKVHRDMVSGKFTGSMKDKIGDKTTLGSIKCIYIRRIPKVGAEGELSTDTSLSGEDSDIDAGVHEGASGAGDDEVADGGASVERAGGHTGDGGPE